MEPSRSSSGSRGRLPSLTLRVFPAIAVLLTAASAWAAEGEPLGPQFTVNTILTNSQGKRGGVATTALSDGGFVVLWNDYYPSPNDVAGQRFNPQGLSVGSEFLVASTGRGEGYKDIVAAGLADGGFIVVWDDEPHPDGDARDVSARRFDSAGTPVGSSFLVNATTAEDQGAQLGVEGLADGTFVVVWSDDYLDDVFGRLFSSTGASLGTEFVVNTALPGTQGYDGLDVAKLDDGGFVVVWSDDSAPGGSGFDVSAQRFDSSGAKVGAQFLANASTADAQGESQLAVAGLEGGGFVITWDASVSSPLESDVKARRFDSGGVAEGSEFIVNSGQFGFQGIFSLGATGLHGGGFVIAWSDSPLDLDSSDVSAQRFDSAGVKIGAQFVVNSVLSGYQGYNDLDITLLKDGGFVVAWDNGESDDPPEVAARLFEGPGCKAVPRDGCTRPPKTILKIKQDVDPTKRQLLWKWLTGTIAPAELGDPTGVSTGYALCVYDDATAAATLHVAPGGTCDGDPCWKSTAVGFRYNNPGTNGDGVAKLQLKSGTGNAKILVKARGANLLPPVPITQMTAVRVQLVRTDDSECWESLFVPAPTKNGPFNFKDKEVVQPECGNTMIEAGEDCDVGDLNGASCATLGFDGGSLACDGPTCHFNTSGCFRNKIAFATSAPYDGNLGGLDGADAVCNAHAFAGGLAGTYRAWLADGTGSPSTRFIQSSQPYELVDGTLVANNWADLTDGTLQNPINRDENGTTVSTPTTVWTNVTTAGATDTAADCVDWTSDSGGDSGGIGSSTSATSIWTDLGGQGCNLTLLLYCFEQ